MSSASSLSSLLSVSQERRNATWEKEFFTQLVKEPCSVISPDPQEGPDGFPYLFVATQPEKQDQFSHVAQWCATRGIGIALNADKEVPDYVFTYGMLWNFVLRGEFLTESATSRSGNLNIQDGQQFLAGPPSEDFWPTPVRKIFKEFMVQQGVLDLKTLVLMEKQDGPADLCFSAESLGNPPEKEWQGILEAFSWFFPRHYSLSIISEAHFKTSFFSL